MNEFFTPFKVTIKNENCKGVLYFLLLVGLALRETTNPRKSNATTGKFSL
jgi:hypothetical protein